MDSILEERPASGVRVCGEVLRGKDVHELEGMKQMGLSVSAISEVTGYDRKTVRKYLLEPEGVPRPATMLDHADGLASSSRGSRGRRMANGPQRLLFLLTAREVR